MIPGFDLQNHPLRDLVTPWNPRSHFTFTNFLFKKKRLFKHLNLPLSHPLRTEYGQYVKWAARHFDDKVSYQSNVSEIAPVLIDGVINAYDIRVANTGWVRAKSLVLAPGRSVNIPKKFSSTHDERIFHFTKFHSMFENIKVRTKPRIAVIGGSQTAVELIIYIYSAKNDAQITGITRNFGYRLKDTSPFSDEVYSPEFVDKFFNASQAAKNKLRKDPEIRNKVSDFLEMKDGHLDVDIDYKIRFTPSDSKEHAPIYLNGLCESSHGMGDAGSFSLLSLRSAAIIESLRKSLSFSKDNNE